jgi:murein tripeptide amidase MpaA
MHISSAFDGGNIDVVHAEDPQDIQLRIRPDVGGEHAQWFYFRVTQAKDQPCTFRILNAGEASYPKAWVGTYAVASIDGNSWVRVPTRYEDGQLILTHTPGTDVVFYAYFAPYSMERHHALVSEAAHRGARVDTLGLTLDGQPLDRLRLGDGPLQLWILARQHPGETMAEWWMEGFIGRLTRPDDVATALLARATLHIVPNMNPDGSRRGHLRTNAAGANLNREWHSPTAERAPEVQAVLAAMDATGVDFCLDVHGDEELPYVFLSGCEGIPSFTAHLKMLTDAFTQSVLRAVPDFQTEYGYGVDAPGCANMTMCTNAVAERYDCLATTLEQPFKDNANTPDPQFGWSPKRSQETGACFVDAIAEITPRLRAP